MPHQKTPDDFTAGVSEPMGELARKLHPEITYLLGDVCTMRLVQLFEAVIIHDAANYLITPDDLRAVIQTAPEHLRPGGNLTVETDHRLVGVFPLQTWNQLLKRVGFGIKQLNWEHSESSKGKPC